MLTLPHAVQAGLELDGLTAMSSGNAGFTIKTRTAGLLFLLLRDGYVSASELDRLVDLGHEEKGVTHNVLDAGYIAALANRLAAQLL